MPCSPNRFISEVSARLMISIGHGVDQVRAVYSAVLSRQGESHHVGLYKPLEILLNQRVERDRAVLVQRVAFVVDLLGIGSDHVAGHVADDLQNAAIVVHRVGLVRRRVIGVAVVGARKLSSWIRANSARSM